MAAVKKDTWRVLAGVIHAGRAYKPGQRIEATEDAMRVAVARGLVEKAPPRRKRS
jgi:hypothetical protein